MRDKILDSIMNKIKSRNNIDKTKCEEIRYGLYGVYTTITKTLTIIIISILLGFVKEFLIFLLFYSGLRSIGYGAHAKTNIQCWIFSTVLLIGIPYLFKTIYISQINYYIIWLICFINFMIFSPADTEKRPMINKYRKFKFKIAILCLSIIYLAIFYKHNNLSYLICSAMILESILVNPLGYLLMGQKPRFKLNDLIFNLNNKK